MSKAQDKFWPMVLSLTFIALISGGLLAVVYQLTKEPIEISKEKSRQEKLKAVLPEFDTLKDTIVYIDHHGELEEKSAIIAYHSGSVAGYAVESEADGYGGPVKVITGYLPDGTIKNYAVLEHQETPGLGAKAEKWFKDKIPGGNASKKYEVSKDGGDVDAITAATITSRAFLKAINRASKVYKAASALPAASDESGKEESK